MNEFWTNVIISDGGNVLLLFLLLLTLSHLLVFPKNLSKRAWKKVDYIWLGVAALGLLSLASDVRISIAKNWSEIESSRAISSLERLRYFYSTPDNTHFCMQFVKSALTPDDVHERQKQHDLRCAWFKDVANILKELEPEKLPEISMDKLPIPTFDDEYLLETVNNIEKHVNWYNEDRRQAIETASLLSKTNLEKNLFYFSPFLLCLALALRIAKVTGELRHEKT